MRSFTKRLAITVLFLIFVFLVFLSVEYLYKTARFKSQVSQKVEEQKTFFKIGEEIVCQIRWKRLRIGTIRLKFLGRWKLKDKDVDVIVSDTKVVNFSDKERIYADPQTYNPLRVERDLIRFGVHSRIIEEYDQEKNTVRITQYGRKGMKERVIENKFGMQNAILLIYKCRRLEDYTIGRTFSVNLPTSKLTMKLSRIESVDVPFGHFDAYLFESSPRKFKLWISVKERYPLRIDYGSVLGWSIVTEQVRLPKDK